MNETRLEQLLTEAKHTYRVPADPPLDEMWSRIETHLFDAPHSRGARRESGDSRRARRSWLRYAAGIAATLAVGIGIGRMTAQNSADSGPPAVSDATQPPILVTSDPLDRTTYEYLDEAVALLASLPRDGSPSPRGRDTRLVSQATQLLGTTRLLLDSPAASDPHLRDLLQDLELVLAQVAQLRAAPRATELTFIAEAMDERDMVPRLRTVAASLTASDY